ADIEHALILCGDVPLLRAETLIRLLMEHRRARRHLTLLAAQTDTPQGYGRILRDARKNVCAIIEEADASEAQKRINVVNTGIYCVNRMFLADSLRKITCQNCQGELYLTDIVAVGYKEGRSVGAIITQGHDEFIGVNSPEDLQRVEAIIRAQANRGNIA
ncbi:MAG: sugar phosphate nucleotidyltransferase, partial [Desulfobacteraceae bacterium]|nr:sugar phosphate nucleotidyltransferase [Desulfobacteraceae bacterium]